MEDKVDMVIINIFFKVLTSVLLPHFVPAAVTILIYCIVNIWVNIWLLHQLGWEFLEDRDYSIFMSTYLQPDSVLGPLHTLSHLNLTTNNNYPHFKHEEFSPHNNLLLSLL